MITTKHPEDTARIGMALAHIFKNIPTRKSLLITLTGDLGSGKSCLARGFIQYLTGEYHVPSPSYLLCCTYPATTDAGDFTIHHIDPYRLKKSKPIENFVDLEELRTNVVLLEHPHKSNIPDLAFDIVINITMSSHMQGFIGLGRNIKIETSSDMFTDVIINAARELELKIEQSDIVPCITFDYADNDVDIDDAYVMGIETSCDDTGIAIVHSSGKIIVQYNIGQADEHAEHGGVKPDVAQKLHAKHLDEFAEKALLELYELTGRYPDAIAFTMGPGLQVSLITGIAKAYELSQKYKIPIVPTHHLESHIMISRLPTLELNVEFPFVSCVVSGGHTFVADAAEFGNYKLLTTTVDDSVGETFDKVGRELGIKHVPAGPHVENLAKIGDSSKYKITKPHMKNDKVNMSFSGIKENTIVLIRKLRESGQFTDQVCADVAASFQKRIVDYFMEKVRTCVEQSSFKTLVVAGGVACNTYLRGCLNMLAKQLKIRVVYPPANLCTDNGVMVAWNGFEKMRSGFAMQPITNHTSDTKVEARARWTLWA